MSMSGSMPAARLAARLPGDAAARPSDRLWPALAKPFVRAMPARGMDLAGERATGWRLRRRAARGLRARADAIIEAATALATDSERAFDEAIAGAREGVLLARNDAGAIDHAFAVAHAAVRRMIGLSLYPEQVMGALAMATGCCAEMATGEGKTLTAILPAALDGWTGRGVHVLTVNDYLARRDAQITSPAYARLGLSVGVLQDSTEPAHRRGAYDRDITYAADKQVIFDYLRDRLSSPLRPSLTGHLLDQVLADAPTAPGDHRQRWSEQVAQRGLHAAIIDEADSILIDEAVTPAIIALAVREDAPWAGEEHYRIAAAIAEQFTAGDDYTVLERLRRVDLTDAGRERLDEAAGRLPPFWAGPRRREELLVQALSARALYRKGDDYIVRDGKVVIVDRSTGRVLEGRQWQLGVHQAVEAREGLEITQTRSTSSRTSYQRFFQRYRRLSGMTGTAWEVRHELWRDYRLPVVRIPTHRPVIRVHEPDAVFTTQEEKFSAVVARVAELHATGRPVLVGTRSVIASERLGEMLAGRGIACRILNATREAEEAEIVAQAGRAGAVTVATNMAGRGTDIILDARSRELGGLVVLATERHDESRVDRQLFGRAGRQGDPGLARAYVSLDDPLIVHYGLRPLVALYRSLPPPPSRPSRRPGAAALWWSSQHTAGRRAAMLRREVIRQDSWLELAMHHESR